MMMAADGGSSNEFSEKNVENDNKSENKSEDTQCKSTEERVFKCCVNKKITNLVCINCFSMFHSSCSKRPSMKVEIIDSTKVICCEGDYNYEEILETQKTKVEITYLKNFLWRFRTKTKF
ncbi:hypothetical protein JTB14_001569 [Gonioctena quinquepunctata]|nr:hypothetical protein JTB14_001569 [Gonioctena quinquepunctata]